MTDCSDMTKRLHTPTQQSRGDGGLVVRLRTRDQGVPGSNPAQTIIENLSHVCSSSPRCINGYPDRVVFVQVCYSLSAISQYMLLEKGREIVSLGDSTVDYKR